MIDEQQWITVAQAASLLDLRKRIVKRWIRSGRLQNRQNPDGGWDVSLEGVEELRRDLLAGQVPEKDEPTEPLFEGEWILSDATTEDEPVVEPPREAPREAPPPEPEEVSSASSANSSRDPLEALEHQAERSIQVAGAAFHEAKELAIAYREELQTARREHREELDRARRNGRFGWTLAAAAILVVLVGAWFLGRQIGDQKLSEIRVSNLTERMGETAGENQKLQARIDALKSESAGVASELRTARLGQADAVGQLAAYRAHAGQLSHRVKVLETQLQQERGTYQRALKKAKQQAVETERRRLAMIRREKAEQAERTRQNLAAQARARQEQLQREQEKRLQAQRERQEQERRLQADQRQRPPQAEALARVDHRVPSYSRRNEAADLTLTELEQALTRKK
ncbi:MAG: hypothetical protein JW849_03995 [Phycisphaerae bacterium]|nr:hypothetical protein [Phycisphaerae bacterium]